MFGSSNTFYPSAQVGRIERPNRLYTASSLYFSSNLVRAMHARESVRGPQAKTLKLRSLTIRPPNYYTRWCTQKVQMTAGNEATSSWFRKWQTTFSQITTKSLVKLHIFLGKSCRDEVISTWAVNSCLGLQKPYRYVRIKWTAKTIDEDPASCKRWISRKEI